MGKRKHDEPEVSKEDRWHALRERVLRLPAGGQLQPWRDVFIALMDEVHYQGTGTDYEARPVEDDSQPVIMGGQDVRIIHQAPLIVGADTGPGVRMIPGASQVPTIPVNMQVDAPAGTRTFIPGGPPGQVGVEIVGPPPTAQELEEREQGKIAESSESSESSESEIVEHKESESDSSEKPHHSRRRR